ncbi:DUF1934 domain-containing protein [Clostridium polynesiense]|uniref:DUF1934 domain-containing protein n=1 Tax=Clostridium polynesiense TaxID=1325933 RepID=UPI0005915B7B|nr:DUF1934 domain-containing protein [Clostridium polynesiense]
MKKKAIISISSNQEIDKDDIIEVITPGDFYKDTHGFRVSYDETEISGMEGTKTKLLITEDKFMLEREGTTTTKMEFQKNNDSLSLYNTPYGMLELKIHTKDLKVNVNEEGGEVFVNYNLSIGGQKPQTTLLTIKIKA